MCSHFFRDLFHQPPLCHWLIAKVSANARATNYRVRGTHRRDVRKGFVLRVSLLCVSQSQYFRRVWLLASTGVNRVQYIRLLGQACNGGDWWGCAVLSVVILSLSLSSLPLPHYHHSGSQQCFPRLAINVAMTFTQPIQSMKVYSLNITQRKTRNQCSLFL